MRLLNKTNQEFAIAVVQIIMAAITPYLVVTASIQFGILTASEILNWGALLITAFLLGLVSQIVACNCSFFKGE